MVSFLHKSKFNKTRGGTEAEEKPGQRRGRGGTEAEKEPGQRRD